ncbi:MAG: zinc ribbon domain-containing protein [Oscillospiraceae bacterium]|nr:zinc ribbon domain-containing protein [Oscillospiraceae bacterium]
MAFFDKLNGIAQSVGEKTSNAIESGKLSLKISGEEKKIAAAVVKLGERFLAKLDAGEVADEETMAIYSEITGYREVIAATQEELDTLKAAKEAPEAPQADDAGAKFCASCGAKLSADARFCPECGKPQQ